MNEGHSVLEDEPDGGARKESSPQGRLKIFFGMAAGVGKTYTMLREARSLLERGEDLVIGWLEPHGRTETEVLAEGIETVKPCRVAYRGIQLAEMDLDAILKRAPDIVIVDELAHSNTPGMRHAKRWEDVVELLDAGISVWTTVNIQHLESWADSVELFTLVPIHERVPDSVFDRADEIQMIDIPPEELIHRLEEGKIYTGPASTDAVRNFFTRGNLGMLREIALRHASQMASHSLSETLSMEAPRGSSPVSQRILVAVSPSPNSQSLIRWARRLAYSVKMEWDCVYIESGLELTEADKGKLAENFALARNLGAKVTSVPNVDIVAGLIGFAQANLSSIIIVGKSGIPERRRLFSLRTITERLIKESGDIPVFVVQEAPVKEVVRKKITRKLRTGQKWQFAAATGAIALVTFLNLFLVRFIGYWAASITFLAAIVILALTLERGPMLLAALLSAVLWDFLFIPPRFTFGISRTEDILMLGLYFLVAATSGLLAGRLKANERLLIVREKRMRLLGDLASELAGTMDLKAIVECGKASLAKAFEGESVVLLEEDDGDFQPEPSAASPPLDEKELSASKFCFSSGRSTGKFTSTLPIIDWHFVPMETPKGIRGVIGLKLSKEKAWGDDQEALLRIMARTVSLAVERELLSEKNTANALAVESERLSKILLDSVSHELRTPLTVIQGAASALQDEETADDPEARASLVGEMKDAVGRLNDIVENLLSMSRIEAGATRLQLREMDPEDLVAAALAAADGELAGHEVQVEYEAGMADSLSCDAGLIVQTLANLLRNSARYAGEKAKIGIIVGSMPGFVSFSVRDDGPGVPKSALEHIFDKFFRVEHSPPGGTGLGLAICRSVVIAHGGRISARNLPEGGLAVDFCLPVKPRGGGRL
jgi:two-component system sensor histidine kinase KdpD